MTEPPDPDRHRPDEAPAAAPSKPAEASAEAEGPPEEINGPKGPEPTRFGDWERKGRCIDF